MDAMTNEYPDLSPVEQQECLTSLETTMKTLTAMREGLTTPTKQAHHDDTVQLLGVPNEPLDQVQALLTKVLPCVSGFTVLREDNYQLDADLRPVPVVEHFICFRKNNDARNALGLQVLQGTPGTANTTVAVNVVKPTQTPTVRAKYRRIGTLVDRLREIRQELEAIGAVRDGGRPRLSSSFIEKTWLAAPNNLPRWKRLRSQGESLDHNAYGALLCKPVARGPIEARIKALYDEECDALIELRDFQLEGIDFNF